MSHHRNPRALLTPAMRGVLDRMARVGHPPLHALTPVQARAAYTAGADVLELPLQPMVRVENFHITARDGFAIPVRLVAPNDEPLPVLVYFHGGGFTIGSIETHDGLCRQLAHHAHCAVLSVDYRLAPEHKFPTAADDAWDVVQWVAQQGVSRALVPSQLALGGDSAGGTLAAVCAILARDASIPIALQLLFYPGTGAHQISESHRTFAHGFVLEEPHISYFFNHYLRNADDRDDWRFAPLDGHDASGHPVDLGGLAPAWFGLAECDPLVDEGVQYADRLRMAGVAVDLEIYRGVVHEFIKMGRTIPEAKKAHTDAARALTHAFKEIL
ncbi:MAG: alpha/beta hydrolase [Pseudomonadota bacterium]